ncbi:glycoside hydrolase family 25 protein [Gemmobacter serpentinus]|uniref:glycoside hydrolase family 25 protein n=1 Tax=Gemmobacter serpentinus TaxID=2652247 RepID=UPI00124C7699|nr:GH25 family lysozyme [Gemmobacter serpentinus]
MRLSTYAFLASLSVLAACGGGGAQRHDVPASIAPEVITAPDFADASPHPATATAARRYAVHGIDVARFQQSVHWPSARASGVNFAFIKATEGGDMVDPMFASHWRGAHAAGVRRGAYHFFYHCRAPEEQARWFFKHVPRRSGDLPPVIDMEWTPTSPTCTIRRSPEVIRADAEVLIRMFTQHYGTAPVLYTTVDFYEDNQMWKLGGTDFWLRSVAAHPSDRYPGQHWAFWQYTSTGLIPGIEGKVDINAFAGNATAWADWLARRAQP